MSSPTSVVRLAAFTISLLLLTESIEPGWGVSPAWGWYLSIILLAMVTLGDLLSLVTFVLAFLLLLGGIEEERASFIALTIFSGAAMLRRLTRRASPSGSWSVRTWRWGLPGPD
ncbi:MAG TPA: hypothetical protein VJB57_12520 [Dehalococcoidia bacterium]|nr:hypothetical protein [Dehalococcoidia bacterium]